MPPRQDANELLIEQAASGDVKALDQLLQTNRKRLRHMVSLQIDNRLQARVDPSDIVQEVMAEASRLFPDYLKSRPLPFYPWLRQLAVNRIHRAARHHLGRARRDVRREVSLPAQLPDESIAELAEQLAARISSPSQRVLRRELRDRVRQALGRLNNDDREVLVLRYLEHMSGSEAAAALGISEPAMRMRQLRALERFQRIIAKLLDTEE
jgi:RNA polymerase sigma-70 factor (ECF subfamily)